MSEVFGARCLTMLSDEATVTVLTHLRKRPLSAVGLQAQAPGLSYRVALWRLRRLVGLGLADVADRQGYSHRSARDVPHTLLASGHPIQTVIDHAAKCEEEWPHKRKPYELPGARALAVSGDRHSREITRALAHGRLRVSDLEALLPETSHPTLERRLRERQALGLIHAEHEGRETWHSLTDLARRSMSVMIFAARWEWHHGENDKALTASDLAGLVHRLAPLARLPGTVDGICLLYEDWHASLQRDVYLSAHGGKLTPFILRPLEQPDASARGDPGAWLDALATGELRRIRVTGDQQLPAAILASLHRELPA